MLSFTVIVTAYDNDAYLPACLESVEVQTYQEWKCLVVNDASPDGTSIIAHGFARRDARFEVLDLPENQGLHLARKRGVERCGGDYALFLDADDELAPDALERMASVLRDDPVDSLHFGIDVVPSGVEREEASSFESYINEPCEALDGPSLCEAIFTERGGYRKDWRVTQRVYSTDMLKRAFTLMTDERLDRAEDCYEVLVLADCTRQEMAANNIKALRYFYGRGVTGTSTISVGAFRRFVDQFEECVEAMKAYIGISDSGRDVAGYVEGAMLKLYDLLMNDWRVRLADGDKESAARYAAQVLGPEQIALQLMRLARDESYSDWVGGAFIDGSERYIAWHHLAEKLVAEDVSQTGHAYSAMRIEARDHIADLERRSVWLSDGSQKTHPIKASSYDQQDIRIFVTTHKDVGTFYSDILQPVQVGPVEGRRRLMWAYQDDDGENIASLNPYYCELTTQYWAWKNVKAEYYGFCHYRRYFDFSEEKHTENLYGEVMDDHIGWETRPVYHMDDESIARAVQGCDVVTTGVNDFSSFPEEYSDPLDLYRRSPYLHEEDLERIMRILVARHPDFEQDVDAYMTGHTSCFCNMFIMRKELFFRYCDWLFPLLEEFCSDWDTELLSHESLRTPGHLAERLLNVFLMHERRLNPGLVWKELQCVHFEHPEHVREPRLAALPGEDKPVVPIVFAADDAYVPMLATTLLSVLENASEAYRYDVVVLERGISQAKKQIVQGFFSRFENAQIRFADVSGMVEAYQLQTNNPHISVETYYRFLIQRVLPDYDKVLYLDSDLIVKDDISLLYSIDLGDSLLAAARDIDFVGNLDIKDENRLAYATGVLHLDDPYGYFQAGVLVLNTAETRKLHPFETWLELASNSEYLYDDQDILNAECQGRVKYLDTAWNVMVNCDNRFKKVFSFAPANMFDDFMRAYADPKIVHYAGYEKPWKPGPCDMEELYWSYARRTPFYEQLLFMVCADRRSVVEGIARAQEEVVTQLTTHERAISEDSPLRGVADRLFPPESHRRELAKSIVRKLRGRS